MILKEGIGLFKIRKPKQFDLPTRYYNPDKERLNSRVNEIKQELGVNEEGKTVRREISFRANVDTKWKREQFKKAQLKANIRILIIVGLLTVAFLYIFQNIDGVFEAIESKTK